MATYWLLPAGMTGKPSPRGLVLYVKGAAETTEERHERPTRETAGTIEECIVDGSDGSKVRDIIETTSKYQKLRDIKVESVGDARIQDNEKAFLHGRLPLRTLYIKRDLQCSPFN